VIDFGIDALYREGCIPPLDSSCSSLGLNEVKMFLLNTCTCGHDNVEVSSSLDDNNDIFIYYCGQYCSLIETYLYSPQLFYVYMMTHDITNCSVFCFQSFIELVISLHFIVLCIFVYINI